MSESINLRVVIFWSIFIFIFAGLGIFGAMNQDLLQEKQPDVIIPVITQDTKTCKGSLERGSVEYMFTTDNDKLNKLRITYTATNGSIDDYAAAANLSNIQFPGVEATIQNEVSNFTLIMYVDFNKLDFNNLVAEQAQLDALSLVVQNVTDYNSYAALITSFIIVATTFVDNCFTKFATESTLSTS